MIANMNLTWDDFYLHLIFPDCYFLAVPFLVRDDLQICNNFMCLLLFLCLCHPHSQFLELQEEGDDSESYSGKEA